MDITEVALSALVSQVRSDQNIFWETSIVSIPTTKGNEDYSSVRWYFHLGGYGGYFKMTDAIVISVLFVNHGPNASRT
jgi:hypothetical protein